ncbi:MAG: ABC transporter substrate-binding protein [Pseudomonadota bacterium]
MASRFLGIVFLLFSLAPAAALERIVFATDWKAQAEHGGFYQALARGYYAERGLDVVIRQGGPGVNIPQLLGAGAVDMGMGSSSFMPLNLLREGAKAKAVMAVFQKSPEILMTHPREDVKSLADMKGRPILLADASIGAVFVWLKAKYGFEDSQIRKYSFNMAPFLIDLKSIQQGYVTSEPFMYEQATGKAPQVFLYADNGYPSYAALVMAGGRLIEQKPAVVQAFVDATREGWRDYLHGDPSPANALILRDNPEMREEVIAQAIAKLKTHGIVESGDAERLGIGAMTDARWAEFYQIMAQNGVYPPDMDVRAAYTLQFLRKTPE